MAAFKPVSYGTITGAVTATATGQPLSGATITVAGFTVTTNSSGQYTINIPDGSYTVTASSFGYANQTATGVQVSQGQATTQNFVLTAAAKVTLSGTVTDGSGHGWPLPVKITVPGTPLAPVYTSPATGAYSISLPGQATYTLHVTPVYPGYAARNVQVQVGASDTTDNITLGISRSGCAAPGYAYQGAGTQFTGWTGFTPQAGWTVTDNNGSGYTWAFGDATAEGQPPGGNSGFAIADSNFWNVSPIDTSLVSPAVNLSGVSSPVIAFDTWYRALPPQPVRARGPQPGRREDLGNGMAADLRDGRGSGAHSRSRRPPTTPACRSGSVTRAATTGSGRWTTCSSAPPSARSPLVAWSPGR